MAKKFETTSLRAHRKRDLFIQALEIESAAERAQFLDKECGKDMTLRQSVLDLLTATDEADEFMANAAVAPPTPAPGSDGKTLVLPMAMFTPAEQPGDHIGHYKILQQIGEGGCGVVYMAEQEKPVRRRIALKVIKLGMDTRSVIARFEAERQALAMMDHPNIAKVLDAGTTEKGRPYFVMELVRGIKITDYCDQENLSMEQRLQLFILVCNAIQHAHQKGIIHRDIKPSNILVTLHDGSPVPKVIDFGIAKAIEQRLTDKTLFTEFHSFIGTPAYMSPEQAEMSGLDIDTRSDIYSLGVLLYQLLTDTTPFDSESLMSSGLDACRRTIRESEPPRPSTRLETMLDADLTSTATHRQIEPGKLIHQLRGDIDWIVMKCLEKDRTRRYGTATDLARDVQRYLENDEVQARPPSTFYRVTKLFRRHRTVFVASTAVALALVGGVGFSAWQAYRATHAERRAEAAQKLETEQRQFAEQEWERAEREKSSAHLNEYVADMNLAQQALQAGNLGRAIQLVEKHYPTHGETDLRGFEWRYLWEMCQGEEIATLLSTNKPVLALAYSPDGNILAAGLPDSISIINLNTRSLITSLARGASSLAFSKDGKLLISGGNAGFGGRGSGQNNSPIVRLWETTSWTEREAINDSNGAFKISADGKFFVVSTGRGNPGPSGPGPRGGPPPALKILSMENFKVEATISNAFPPFALSPDGSRLVHNSFSGSSGVMVRSLSGNSEGKVLADSTNLFGLFSSPNALTFSPDGKYILAPHNTVGRRGVYVLGIWNAETGEEIGSIPNDPERIEHTGIISAISFAPDNKTIATSSFDHSIRLWNFETHDRIATLQGHRGEVWSQDFSPNGKILATGSKEGSVKIWEVRGEKKEDTLAGRWQPLRISLDGKMFAALGRSSNGVPKISFFSMASREMEYEIELVSERRFGPGGFPGFLGGLNQLFGLSADFSTVALLKRDGKIEIRNLDGNKNNELVGSDAEGLVLAPNGKTLLSWKRGQRLTVWDLRTGSNSVSSIELNREPGRDQVIFSPSSDSFLTFQRTNAIQVWDAASLTLRSTVILDQSEGPRNVVSYSQNGKVIAVAFGDDTVHLFEVASGKPLMTLAGHKQPVISTAFAPDGQTIATSGADSTLKFWNVATGQELLNFRKLGEGLQNLFYSADGKILISGGTLGGGRGGPSSETPVRFYHARSLEEIDRQHRTEKRISDSAPSPLAQ